MRKNEIIMEDYFDALQKVKDKIVQTQNHMMTTANIERNILYWCCHPRSMTQNKSH